MPGFANGASHNITPKAASSEPIEVTINFDPDGMVHGALKSRENRKLIIKINKDYQSGKLNR